MTRNVKIPTRNAPCPCGSGRKYKHCCAATVDAPDWRAELSAAVTLERAGQWDAAAIAYETLLAEAPDALPVLEAAALFSFRRGERGTALQLLRKASAGHPENAEVLNLLGGVLIEERLVAEGIVALHRAVTLRPDFTEAHANLGYALFAFGRLDEAELCLRRALAISPGHPAALLNLATVLRAQERYDESLTCLREVLLRFPDHDRAWHNLAQTLQDLGRWADCVRCYEEAARLLPGSATVQCNLGLALKELGEYERALTHFERAVALDPQQAEAHLLIGIIRKEQGRLPEALVCFSRALAIRPNYHAAHSNILFTTAFMDELSQMRIYELHREWAALQATGVPRPASYQNPRDPARKLRIAYVSPDLRQHPCAAFLEPLLRHHDRSQVEVFAYAEVSRPDAKTAELRTLTDHWRSTVGVDDEQMVKMVRDDGIDVLIDLAGHTANNRLLALARQPAPVQLTYLGYPATTGLPAMGWRLTDAITEPPGSSDAFYTERLYRLPHSLWCYQPFPDMVQESSLPALERGYLTFGSFNSYAKVGSRVVELWARVLKAVPDSRLLMITVPAGQATEALRERFARLGITPDRLDLRGRMPRADYVNAFAEVDVALDPFPCNGGTTTCDALWMGLPVVALRGERFLSRASLSVLTAAGCAEFSAADDAEYVARCVDFARDVPGLASVRAGLRSRLAASPLMDAAGFTRDVEAAYRSMWRDWCGQGEPG